MDQRPVDTFGHALALAIDQAGHGGDQVVDFTAVGMQRPLSPVMLSAQAQLGTARLLGLQLRIAESRVVQLVEGRRLVGLAIAGRQQQGMVQLIAIGQAASVMATELLILVTTQIDLPLVTPQFTEVLAEQTMAVAIIPCIGRAAIDLVALAIYPQAEHMPPR